ncbi:unnamed protein product, partial [Mesorhabditis belari]|uniref:Major facilitator superfamily (MFS) profile domain-containing protein n=1 Tax=Mesorhabditis belari TaxID=2138241 RepID=A0AAF3EJI6_9BILA
MDDPPRHSKCQKLVAVLILLFINLLNKVDQSAIAMLLIDIQKFFGVDGDGEMGLLQAVYIVLSTLCIPVFGYLGLRYKRKWIMVIGTLVGALAGCASTFVAKESFWLFLLMRSVVAIGMLVLFYITSPFGRGIGYIFGLQMAKRLGGWQWGIWLIALLGVASVILMVLFVFDPERKLSGSSNSTRKEDMENAPLKVKIKTYLYDLWALMKNYTYLFSTIAYTCIVFVTGSVLWWVPTAIQHAKQIINNFRIALYFGAVTMVGEIVGVIMGSAFSTLLRNGKWCFKCCQTQRSNPIISAVGALIATPFLLGGLQLIRVSVETSYIFIFVAITGLCFNWTINGDLLMTITVPWRRNSAKAWQTLISHLFGDALGPYLVGLLADRISLSDSPRDLFDALLYAFYIPSALCGISAFLFIIAAITVIRDQARCLVEIGIDDRISSRKDVETKGNANKL